MRFIRGRQTLYKNFIVRTAGGDSRGRRAYRQVHRLFIPPPADRPHRRRRQRHLFRRLLRLHLFFRALLRGAARRHRQDGVRTLRVKAIYQRPPRI